MNIGIVGLGTIGGSFAKSLSLSGQHRIFGTDINEDSVAFAKFTDSIESELNDKTLQLCDVLFLALYPQETVKYLREHGDKIPASCTVMDCCGVKRAIFDDCVQLAEQHGFTFIGGHPMAGAVASGFRAAREKMFRGASMILIPGACDSLPILDKLCVLFREMGFSRIITTTPQQHDRMIAFTSQLPHILSNAYVKSPVAPEHRGYSGGSYRDMARVARVNVPMWTELFLENADFLAEELDIMIQNLVLYKEALQQKDASALAALLTDGANCKAALDKSEKIPE